MATTTGTMETGRHAPAAPTTTTWRIDRARSRATFTVGGRLLGVKAVSVSGSFAPVAGTVLLDEQQPTRSHVALAIDATAVATGSARRDRHLRSAAFFDAERFPAISFFGRLIEAVEPRAGVYRVVGDLTVAGTASSVALDVAYDRPPGHGRGPIARFVATGELDRRDFGLTWNPPLPLRVADAVRVAVVVEAILAERRGEAARPTDALRPPERVISPHRRRAGAGRME